MALLITLIVLVLLGIAVPLAIVNRVYEHTFFEDALRAAERLVRRP